MPSIHNYVAKSTDSKSGQSGRLPQGLGGSAAPGQGGGRAGFPRAVSGSSGAQGGGLQDALQGGAGSGMAPRLLHSVRQREARAG